MSEKTEAVQEGGTRASCSCERCKGACRFKPGWFLPGEAEKVAEHLGIPLLELFKTRLGVEYWVGDPDVFVLSPATVTMQPGTEFPYSGKGRCTFLTADGLCEIHPVKPYECREFLHGDDVSERHKGCADAWRTEPAQQQICDLLGRTAGVPEHDIFDIMGMW